MPTNLNPYDTGDRLEPKSWPLDPTAPYRNAGVVDFTDDEDATQFTVRILRTEPGYIARVDEVGNAELNIRVSAPQRDSSTPAIDSEPSADDGAFRLTPAPWSTGSGDDVDHYGRVNFNDPSGATKFTVHFEKNEAGYLARIDQATDLPLVVETSTQRQERESAMQYLDQQLNTIAQQHFGTPLEYEDPDTFGAGHFVITNEGGDHRIVVTEQYVGTDSSDDERIPNTWTLDVETHAPGDGWVAHESSQYGPADVQQLSDRADTWATDRVREQNTHNALHSQSHHMHHTPSAAPGIAM